MYGPHDPVEQTEWFQKVFSVWLKTIEAHDIILIAGNHDFFLETKEGKDAAEELTHKQEEFVYLEDDYIILGEGDKQILVYGTPWVPNLEGWAFYASTVAAQGRYSRIPTEVDILVSHGPPHGFGDRVSFSHAGSQPLLHAIRQRKIKTVVCGHIHEGYGSYYDRESDTRICCVSHMDRNYKPINPPVEVILNTQSE